MDRSGGGFRATHDQPARLDCGRCKAPAPYYFYKDGKLVCRGAGDSHLPRSLRARSPHGLSPRRRFQPLTDEERSSESRRALRITSGIPPELSNLIYQVLTIERIGPLRRGFRATHDQPARLDCGRCNAPAPYYFYKDGKLVCRGAGDSHLPQPSCSFSRRRFQRGTKFREPTGQRITAGDSAGALELDTSSSRH